MMRSLLLALVLSLCGMPGLAQQPGGAFVSGPRAPDGSEVDVDLPGQFHTKNTGGMGREGPGTGAGLCVYASARHAGFWHDSKPMQELFLWMRNHPGGSYPRKFDEDMKRFCQEKNYVVPAYIHLEGSDLEPLAMAVNRGHMAGVTYCKSPTGRYRGQTISHMVNCVAARVGPQRLWCILDNNYPGANQYEWMTEEQFRAAYVGRGGGWSIILLMPAPPPILKTM